MTATLLLSASRLPAKVVAHAQHEADECGLVRFVEMRLSVGLASQWVPALPTVANLSISNGTHGGAHEHLSCEQSTANGLVYRHAA